MSQSKISTPKMRCVYTPRVKSAQIIQNLSPKKPLFFTSHKLEKNQDLNPQIVEKQIAKKLNMASKPSQGPSKIDIVLVNTQKNIYPKKSMFSPQKGPSKHAKKLWTQQSQRMPQWPVADKPRNLTKIQQASIVPKRCQSASSLTSTNSILNSQKSSRIKQHQKNFSQKFNTAFSYLLEQNTQYLNQKSRMCTQKSRPSSNRLTINRANLTTTYKDLHRQQDNQQQLIIEPQNEKPSILLSCSKVCGNSMQQEAHQGRSGSRGPAAQWVPGFKLEGPISGLTTCRSDYPDHGQFQKMIPVASFNEHPLGMEFKSTSSNSKFLTGQFVPKSKLATWNNLNPYGNNFSPDRGTQYSNAHNLKNQQHIQQWPLPEHKLLHSQTKYNTQSRVNYQNFNSHELNQQNHCKCGQRH